MTAASSSRVTGDGRRILAAQALRAAVYGFGAVQLGVTLAAHGWSSGQLGGLLAAMVPGPRWPRWRSACSPTESAAGGPTRRCLSGWPQAAWCLG